MSQALIPAKNYESSVLQRQQPCFPDRMVGEQKATPSSVPGTRPVKGKLCLLHTLLLSPTRDLIQRTEQTGSRVAGLGPSPSPGLEEDSQATRRCSVLGPGLSGRTGKARPGLVLVQFDQSKSFLLALGFKVSADTLPVSGDFCGPGRDEWGGGLFRGENS